MGGRGNREGGGRRSNKLKRENMKITFTMRIIKIISHGVHLVKNFKCRRLNQHHRAYNNSDALTVRRVVGVARRRRHEDGGCFDSAQRVSQSISLAEEYCA